MEITIIKQVFTTEEIPDNLSEEDLKDYVDALIDNTNDDGDWDETDWRGKEVYEAYDTYSGCTILKVER